MRNKQPIDFVSISCDHPKAFVITNAKGLESYHQYRAAFDIAFKGNVPYPNDFAKWEKVGKIGESLGLIWGGRFNDLPHFEYHPEFTWETIKENFI